MDLNSLLRHHQRALIDIHKGSSPETRRWAGLSAAFYADQIVQVRRALGREDPFTWSGANGGIVACG